MSILPTFYVGTAFAHVDPESVKNTVKSSVSFYAFGIYERKICTKNVGEIDSRGRFHQRFCARFSYERLFSSYVLVTSKKSAQKTREKTLVKSTPGGHSCCILSP